MAKNPSSHRTSDITHYRQAKANLKKKNIYKVLDKIAELERQLKIHPMGAIILKAEIKEKRDKLAQLDPEGKTFHTDKQMKDSAQQGKLGLSVAGLPNLGTEQTISKAVFDDETLRATKYGSLKTERFP